MDNNNIKFSVVMPVYYEENPLFFDEALKSIINQTLMPNEIVIVKDGKLTEELDLVINNNCKTYQQLIKVISLDHVGKGYARNEGIKNCSYDYIALMDSDDISSPDRFKKQIDYIKQHPEIDVLGGQYTEFENEPNNIIAKKVMPIEQEDIYNFGKWRSPMNNVTLILKKDKILEVGGFNNFYIGEDYHLYIKMLTRGMQFHNLDDVLVNVRAGKRMYKKRVGLKIIVQEIQLFTFFYSIGYINFFQLIRNISLKFLFRIMPCWLREMIYIKYLRKAV